MAKPAKRRIDAPGVAGADDDAVADDAGDPAGDGAEVAAGDVDDAPDASTDATETSASDTDAGDAGESDPPPAAAAKTRRTTLRGGDKAAAPVGRAPVKKVDLSTRKPAASSRYTPPEEHADQLPSPMWVPVLMFTLFALGMAVIILNYVSLLPGSVSNWYLLLGLGFILGGIITATQYR